MANGLPKDPMLLLSVVNTKLRDYYHNKTIHDDNRIVLVNAIQNPGIKEEIVNTLKTIDYEYDENRHQFV